MMDAATICRNLEYLKANRARLNSELEQAAALCQPAKVGGTYYTRQSSQEGAQPRGVEVLCDFPQEAAMIFNRGLYSNLFPPNVRWFSFQAAADQKGSDRLNEFLTRVSQTIYDILYGTNFPVEMNEICSAAACAGTFVMSVEYDPEDFLRFEAHPLQKIYCQKSGKQNIDTVYEEIPLTASQAATIFSKPGDQLGEKLRKDAADDLASRHDKIYKIIHYVAPNRNRKFRSEKVNGVPVVKPVAGVEGSPFISIYVEADEKVVIREEGFDYNPYTVGRIDESINADVYGLSPALRALRTMKTQNKLWARYMEAVDSQLRPSVVADLAAYSDLLPEFNFSPNSVNYYNSQGGKYGAPTFYVPPANLAGGIDLFDRMSQVLNRFFCADLFTLIQNMNISDGRQRTAREIAELVNERNSQLLTIVSRFLDELVSPLLKKCFWVLWNNVPQIFGEVDESIVAELAENPLNLTYFSPMAMAARATRIQGTMAAVEDAVSSGLLQFAPDALDVIKTDELMKAFLEVRGAHPDHFRSEKELRDLRAKRAEEQQMQQQQQMIADIAKSQNLNESPGAGSLAGALMGGM
jgi:hypothetical protein